MRREERRVTIGAMPGGELCSPDEVFGIAMVSCGKLQGDCILFATSKLGGPDEFESGTIGTIVPTDEGGSQVVIQD